MTHFSPASTGWAQYGSLANCLRASWVFFAPLALRRSRVDDRVFELRSSLRFMRSTLERYDDQPAVEASLTVLPSTSVTPTATSLRAGARQQLVISCHAQMHASRRYQCC